MKRLLLAAALAAACSPPPQRIFPVGLEGPVSPRVAAEAARLGFDVSDAPAPEADVAAAGAPVADRASLRLAAARAAEGAGGFFIRLPRAEGREALDYPEEWQAVVGVLRELASMKPIFEGGDDAPIPFAVPPGLDARAWSYRGRRYVLLVNSAAAPAELGAAALGGRWRALFEARSDPRQVLRRCGAGYCLEPARALWLEESLF